jgi:Flp pilus assembly protein TadD
MTIQEAMELALSRHRAGKFAEADAVYRQVLSSSPDHADALNLLGVLAWQFARHDEAIALISRAIEVSPACGEYYVNLGAALDDMGKLDEAVAAYRKALAIKPRYPRAMSNLANTLRKQGQTKEAVAACREALAIEPGSAQAYTNLGAAVQRDDLNEAIRHYRWAISLQPDYADAHHSLGSALMLTGALEEATAACRHAITLKPHCPQSHTSLGSCLARAGDIEHATAAFRHTLSFAPKYAPAHWNLALMLLLQGDFQNGWPEYEWRLRVNEFRWHLNLPKPRWTGGSLAGRRILLHAEHGIGDVLQFIRLVPRVIDRGGRVAVVCQRSLHRLLKQIAGVEEWTAFEDPLPSHDVQCPIMSLPLVLGATPQNIGGSIPYLNADETLSGRWQSRLPRDERLKIGLVWAGGGANQEDRSRFICPSLLSPLARVGEAFFCSLQKSCGPRQQNLPMQMPDWTDELTDFAETAALIDNLDLVITVDTAVAHLAGAMGKAVWVLLPFFPDWRWMLRRTDSPWYPTMRLFRQERPGDWSTPINRVVEALQEL